jgi:hypothetical protein
LGIYALKQTQGEKEVMQFIEQLLASNHGNSDTTQSVVQFYYQNPVLKWDQGFIAQLTAFLNH